MEGSVRCSCDSIDLGVAAAAAAAATAVLPKRAARALSCFGGGAT